MKRLAKDEDGAALVEMTLAAPLLIALAVGAMAFGQILLDYGTANKSMRDATRFLSRLPAGAVCGWGLTSAKNMAVYGQETAGTTPRITGWTTSTITLTSPDCSGTPTDPFNVKLQADIPYTNSLLGALGLSSSFTMSVNHEEPHIGR
jgi:Flp pilus assembly protein TadG